MAKEQMGFKTTNSVLDKDERKLVETTKDGVNVFYIDKIIEKWHGIEGISFAITLNKDVEPDETEY